MNNKRLLKTIGIILVVLALVFTSFISFRNFKNTKTHITKNKPFKNYIGYIDKENALLNNKYKLCNEENVVHTYSSAGFKAYSGTKKQFKNTLISQFNNNSYTDSGYLNFRFFVNCEGNPGWFEIIEMDLNLNEKKLNQDMVYDLFQFTSKPSHWNIISYREMPQNYYMYISYRIENGKVTEIIP